MEDSKDLRTKTYAVDRAFKAHDASKRLLPKHLSDIRARESYHTHKERLQRDKTPFWDGDPGFDDSYNVDVQLALLDEWARRVKDAQEHVAESSRRPTDAPIEEFVVGLLVDKSKFAENEGYELVRRQCERVIAVDDEAEKVPEPHDDWECIEKETRDPPQRPRSYAAVLHGS